jgi:16S rRNA (adenine1518-N6/adenine1519-N6)-dimethyltransferase
MKQPFGQNFLFDKNILNKIVSCSGVTGKDTVVEIGPGLGTLTRVIALKSKKVIAIEFDKKLIGRLTENVSDLNNVEIVNLDALKFPYENIRGTFTVIANIPYNITTPLIFRLLEYKSKLKSMTLLMQKEVAQRIVAQPGTREYGVLSLSTRLYTKPSLKFIVSKKAFSPPPKIDSAVVHFRVSAKPCYPVKDAGLFLDIVKTAFGQRRKTIKNSLKSFHGLTEALDMTSIDPSSRPETLSMQEFIHLADALLKTRSVDLLRSS